MEEQYVGLTILDLKELKNRSDSLAGRWNGKTEQGEDEARLYLDISEATSELIKLLEEII